MEWCLLIENQFGRVASIDILLAIGVEECVRMVRSSQIGQGNSLVTVIVSYKPEVGFLPSIYYRLEGKRYRPAFVIIAKDIFPSSIID